MLIPLSIGDDLIGFVVLTGARTNFEINWEVVDLLKTASCQAASYIAQVQAAEALVEAKKFDSFNRMSAFVVHDLKNIVTQLALMLRNAEKHKHNPEFQDDMLMTVNHAVEKMRQLMMQLREGATPHGSVCGVSLSAIIRSICQHKQQQGRTVDFEISEDLFARGHEDRLARVIDHIVQNALDAIDTNGYVRIALAKNSGFACVTVQDNGCGMSDAFIREKLFKPFQTTKNSGMGIGAYESAQYVRELGGKIEVESAVGEGSKFQVFLPIFNVDRDASVFG